MSRRLHAQWQNMRRAQCLFPTGRSFPAVLSERRDCGDDRVLQARGWPRAETRDAERRAFLALLKALSTMSAPDGVAAKEHSPMPKKSTNAKPSPLTITS